MQEILSTTCHKNVHHFTLLQKLFSFKIDLWWLSWWLGGHIIFPIILKVTKLIIPSTASADLTSFILPYPIRYIRDQKIFLYFSVSHLIFAFWEMTDILCLLSLTISFLNCKWSFLNCLLQMYKISKINIIAMPDLSTLFVINILKRIQIILVRSLKVFLCLNLSDSV